MPESTDSGSSNIVTRITPMWVLLQDGAGGLYPVDSRHPDIHQDDVGYQLTRFSQSLLASRRFAHDLDAGHLLEQRADPFPE